MASRPSLVTAASAAPAVRAPPPYGVALVACAALKRDRPSPARDLYASTLFRKARAHAEASARAWFVLSAAHGLVEPGQILAPYDESLTRMPAAARRAWSTAVLADLLPRLAPRSQILVLAGARYAGDLVPALIAAGHEPSLPLQGLGIGRQLQWLTLARAR